MRAAEAGTGVQDASGPCFVLWPLEAQVRTINLTEDKDGQGLLLLVLCLLTQQAAWPVPEQPTPASIQMTLLAKMTEAVS